jgi:alkanesulfonate monooxygenase SsuD/methylene tetrahydromethanopterin reductase-like flavin-dependent oxidoreductase (luciferase family)
MHLSERYGMRFEPHHVERLCVAGTREECAARLQEYADAGAAFVSLNPAVDEDGFLGQVERLATVARDAIGALA